MNQVIKDFERQYLTEREFTFSPGDTILVSSRIREGDKERLQPFQGVVIKQHGSGINQTFTVRKSSGNVFVERVFPLHSPMISDIKLVRRGKVRRARLYYLRGRTGKATRIKEKK